MELAVLCSCLEDAFTWYGVYHRLIYWLWSYRQGITGRRDNDILVYFTSGRTHDEWHNKEILKNLCIKWQFQTQIWTHPSTSTLRVHVLQIWRASSRCFIFIQEPEIQIHRNMLRLHSNKPTTGTMFLSCYHIDLPGAHHLNVRETKSTMQDAYWNPCNVFHSVDQVSSLQHCYCDYTEPCGTQE